MSSLPEPRASVYDRTFWLAYLANTILVLANALTFRFAELVHYLGGTERVAGDIVALALTISVAVRLSASHVIDDFGTRRVWLCCTALFVTGGTLFLLCDRLNWLIYAARIAFVVGLTGMFACSVTHIQNHVPAHRRTEVIGNLGSSGFIGMILGSNVGDWILHAVPQGRPQFVALFGTATLIGLLYGGVVLCLTHGQQHTRPHPAPAAFRLLVRHWPGMVVAVAMIMGLGVTVTTVFLTRFATEQHISSIGVFFTGYALSAFSFRMLAANWSRTIGRHWMLVRGLLGHALGHLLLSFANQGWQFVLPSVVCGFGHALLFPAVVSLGAGAFPKEVRGAGTAIILGFTDFGSLVFSPILGRIIVASGFQPMFWTSSGLAGVVAAIYVVIALRFPDAEAEEYRVATITADLD
uniref:MFS transporter n=1 Tax=Schlesneria paludicola TaxID=360056 RepID=A0A7C4QMH6_9PLAN